MVNPLITNIYSLTGILRNFLQNNEKTNLWLVGLVVTQKLIFIINSIFFIQFYNKNSYFILINFGYVNKLL